MSLKQPSNQETRKKLISILENADEHTLNLFWYFAKQNDLIPKEKKKENQLYRLVYTSARTHRCTDEDIDKILEASRRNNPSLGVTGLLICSPKRFLQIIEGTMESTQTLYEKIKKDPRHIASNLRFFEPVEERLFSDWNMAHKDVNSPELAYKANINPENKELYDQLVDGNLQNYHDNRIRVLKAFLAVS